MLRPTREVTLSADKPATAYRIPLDGSEQLPPYFVGIATAGERPSSLGSHALSIQTQSGPGTAKLCFGTEGVNVIFAAGEQSGSLYLDLGYDIAAEPRCRDSDFKK